MTFIRLISGINRLINDNVNRFDIHRLINDICCLICAPIERWIDESMNAGLGSTYDSQDYHVQWCSKTIAQQCALLGSAVRENVFKRSWASHLWWLLDPFPLMETALFKEIKMAKDWCGVTSKRFRFAKYSGPPNTRPGRGVGWLGGGDGASIGIQDSKGYGLIG